jgi:glycosyltransferase involved in cell wall biosynthesis
VSVLALKKVSLYAVVPCLNEEENIGILIDRLKYHDVTPIVVDDGSTDKTCMIAKRKGVVLVRHRENRGPGAAIESGYLYAKKRADSNSIVFVVAGDRQHDPDETSLFVDEILVKKADYVVGERFSSKPLRFGMPPMNFVFGKILNRLTSLILGIEVKDSTSGFTAIRMSALKRLELNLPARAGETHEILLECVKRRLRIAFVPIKPIYLRKSKISRFTFLRSILQVYLRAL